MNPLAASGNFGNRQASVGERSPLPGPSFVRPRRCFRIAQCRSCGGEFPAKKEQTEPPRRHFNAKASAPQGSSLLIFPVRSNVSPLVSNVSSFRSLFHVENSRRAFRRKPRRKFPGPAPLTARERACPARERVPFSPFIPPFFIHFVLLSLYLSLSVALNRVPVGFSRNTRRPSLRKRITIERVRHLKKNR